MIARLHDGLPLAASVQDHDQVSSMMMWINVCHLSF